MSTSDLIDLFGPVIHRVTRAQLIADGQLIDVSATAREKGVRFPVAVSAGLWADINAIPASKSWQDVTGRLHDVVWMLRCAIIAKANQTVSGTATLRYQLIMHVGRTTYYTVKAHFGPGDDGTPVITLLRPNED